MHKSSTLFPKFLLSCMAFLHMLLPLEAYADALDQMTFRQLGHYVEFEASAKQLSALAQRQFYFEVNANQRAAAEDYSTMQQAIANKIPTEYARPVFDVRFIFGNKSAVNDQHTVGILGGTGPLSDANIAKLVMQELNPGALSSATMIHLFSLPPPRTTKDQVLGGVTYTARLTAFVRHGYAEYFLASNTAYLNYNKIVTLSGSNHINHLPRMIADRIAEDQAARNQFEPILILGTKQAWEGRLYNGIFDEKQMAYAQPTADEQNALQTWIDRIKQGTLTFGDSLQLKTYLAKLGTVHQSRDLLLSCTELPLGLGSLMQDLRDEAFVIYDSESMIADIIVEKTESL